VDVGIAFDLKTDFEHLDRSTLPSDALDEYDSATTVEAIEAALTSAGHRVVRLGGGRRFIEGIVAHRVDIVFNIAEGRGSRSREAHVPAVCEIVGVPCTHSDPLTMGMTLDKGIAKRVVSSAGVSTAAFVVVERALDLRRFAARLEALRYPLFVKPLYEGSSIGIDDRSRVLDPADLEERILALLGAYGEPVLVEEFLGGPEFTVAILGDCREPRAAATMEIVPLNASHADFIYSNDVKHNWETEVTYHTPPRRSRAEIERVEAVALAAYSALGCRDVARVDVRHSAAGEPHFIECNPLPGLAPDYSDIAIAWAATGRAYEELVLSILDQACARQG
jgi:D-alanine-D-alanine ligase